MKTFPIVPSQYQHLPNIPFIIVPQEYLGNHGALYLVNTKQIYVGDAFLKLLTDRELTALLLHEFGHHTNLHHHVIAYWFSKGVEYDSNTTTQIEIEADTLACCFGYSEELKSALTKTYLLLIGAPIDTPNPVFEPTFQTRMDHINNYSVLRVSSGNKNSAFEILKNSLLRHCTVIFKNLKCLVLFMRSYKPLR